MPALFLKTMDSLNLIISKENPKYDGFFQIFEKLKWEVFLVIKSNTHTTPVSSIKIWSKIPPTRQEIGISILQPSILGSLLLEYSHINALFEEKMYLIYVNSILVWRVSKYSGQKGVLPWGYCDQSNTQ